MMGASPTEARTLRLDGVFDPVAVDSSLEEAIHESAQPDEEGNACGFTLRFAWQIKLRNSRPGRDAPMCLLAIEEAQDQVPEESLIAAPGVVFAVQNLHRKMMHVKSTVCNRFYNF